MKARTPQTASPKAAANREASPDAGFSTPEGLGNAGLAEGLGLGGGGGAGGGAPGGLPHGDAIQQAFGRYDVGGIEAHGGDEAAAIGAEAFTRGDEVAFAGSPDLHMAAHEAAHVVQQRAGVGPAGGVGEKGDAQEKQADAVADAVVAGEDAEPLLAEMAGGKGESGPAKPVGVQAYAGDLNTPAAEQMAQAPGQSVAQARDAIHGEGVARDDNANNALKVKFEGELAGALLAHDGFYRPVVSEVSKNIMSYLETKAQVAGAGDVNAFVDQELAKMKGMYGGTKPFEKDLYFGRISDTLAGMANEAGPMGKLRAVLAGGGTIPNQVYAHHQFMDDIYGKDFYGDGPDGIKGYQFGVAKQILDKMNAELAADQQLTAVEPKALRAPTASDASGLGGSAVTNPFGMQVDATGQAQHVLPPAKKGGAGEALPETGDPGTQKGVLNEQSNTGVGGRHARGRSTETDPTKGQYVAPQMAGRTEAPRTATATGIGNNGPLVDPVTQQPLTAAQGGEQKHGRGVDVYTLDESQLFVQQARIELDMPLAAGVSGTTTDLFEIATTFGVSSPDEKFKYALACLAQLMGAGAHSFHEIMTAANSAGVQLYRPGDYRSIKEGLAGHPAAALFDKPDYAAVPGIGMPPTQIGPAPAAPAAPAAAPAPAGPAA
jgi:hypothetical protein